MNALIVFSALVCASQATLLANIAGGPIATTLAGPAIGAPVIGAPVVGAPVAPALPAALAAPSSQFQAQDELGNVNYGYANINSAKQEVGNAYGGVTGAWSWVDAYGIPQRTEYISDGLGFRVRSTALPIAPAAPAVPEVVLPIAPEVPVVTPLVAPVFDLPIPQPVQDTPEVAEAKAAHLAKLAEATKDRKKRSVWSPSASIYAEFGGLNLAPLASQYGLGLGLAAPALAAPAIATPAIATPAIATPAIAAPAIAGPALPAVAPYNTLSEPATREAILTKIKLNPGHALFYRVD